MAKTPIAEQSTEKTVRVYSRSRRSFIHGKHAVAPGTFTELPESVAALLLKSYPLEIIESATAQKELGGQGAIIAEQKSRIAELEAQLATLQPEKSGKGKGKAAADAI